MVDMMYVYVRMFSPRLCVHFRHSIEREREIDRYI